MKKAGIFTFHRARNIGTSLQAYALQTYLEKKLDRVDIVDYRPKYIEDSFGVVIKSLYNESKSSAKKHMIFWIKTILRSPFSIARENNFKKFREKYLHISNEHFDNVEELENGNLDYSYYAYGSDQIWNPDLTHGVDYAYLGAYVPDTSIRFAYAASIGKDNLDQKELKELQEGLKYLDYVGVREASAKAILEPACEKPIALTLDPTLLLEKENWLSFIKPNTLNYEYVFVYVLERNEELIKIAKNLAIKKGLKIVFLDLKNPYGKLGKSKSTAGPEEFLNYLYHAEYVVTNSFHGTVFSVIFNKQFVSVPFKQRSTRVVDLLNSLGIGKRIVYTENEMIDIDAEIDYEAVKKRLEEKRTESKAYIDQVLADGKVTE